MLLCDNAISILLSNQMWCNAEGYGEPSHQGPLRTSAGPKKKDRRTFSGMIILSLVSGTCSNSRWLHVMRGGSLAMRSSLRHTGAMEGLLTPRAISAQVFMNCDKPAPSLIMVWFTRVARMKPPLHLSRVTYDSISPT